MADDGDDSWLYGGGPDDASRHEEKTEEEGDAEAPVKNGNLEENTFDEHNFEEAGEHEHLIAEDSKDGDDDQGTQGEDMDDSDTDSDDINVVIGDIKAGGSSYVKNPQDKQKLPGSKFNIEEFESVGSINGVPAFEFAIENIEDKPWRKPGADITDYFNYGFNEETWRAYCERQKKMRIHESGVGLAGLTAAQNPQGHMEPRQGINIGIKRLGGPRPKPSGTIDVIGAPSQNPIRPPAPRENIIQVMTADRREYSRTVVGNNLPNSLPIPFNVPPEEFYHEEDDAFNYGYEPTQDSQWQAQNPGWAPSEIKELTGMNQPPPMMGLNQPPPMMVGGMPPRMPPNLIPGVIPSLMSQVTTMPHSLKPSDSRDRRDRESSSRHYDESRKRPREASPPRERDRKERDRPREERTKYDRDARESRHRETSSRRETRRSKSREKSKRSKSREKSRRSRSKDRKPEEKEKEKERSSRSDKSKRSKKEDS